ncbi:uncharacterized protein CLAFUR5_20359 [Fulvia fulva]|uniref:uncharacterized protein n=1 Tax=Passalora fulva TaxID=5499 RepID=UPI00285292AA|nr:uncharacterized protein CLAFUR5_20359 [Fulvia fulva]WMI39068.1 hypothetical protein CLAFUR5_20359 [Fulvia fulva]
MAAAEDNHCRILELPAELRNRIYRLTLSQEEQMDVTETGFEIPGVLKTCRQIRSEALAIYFYENRFRVTGASWNSDTLFKLTSTIKSMGLDTEKMPVDGRWTLGPPSWKNLMLWLQRYHAQELQLRPSRPASMLKIEVKDPVRYAVGSLGVIVDRSRDQSWTRVKKTLDALRPMLIILNRRWEED